MKALLDTTAINWLTDQPAALDLVRRSVHAGLVSVLVPLEVHAEVSRTVDPTRRAQLRAALEQFGLTPTRVPRLGAFRLGQARIAQEHDIDRLHDLQFLRGGHDRSIAANAGGYSCDVFITRDFEMSRKKGVQIEAETGCRVIEPQQFITELRLLQKENRIL